MCECVFIRMADYAVSSFFGFLFRFISDEKEGGDCCGCCFRISRSTLPNTSRHTQTYINSQTRDDGEFSLSPRCIIIVPTSSRCQLLSFGLRDEGRRDRREEKANQNEKEYKNIFLKNGRRNCPRRPTVEAYNLFQYAGTTPYFVIIEKNGLLLCRFMSI